MSENKRTSKKKSNSRIRWSYVLILTGLLFWFLNVSRPGKIEEGCPIECAPELLPGEGDLKVLSLNVLHGFPTFPELQARLDHIVSEAQRLDIDVLLLQEMPWTIRIGNSVAYLADKLAMNHLYLRANGNRRTILFEEGVAILSRFPIVESRTVELQPRAGFFEHRVVLGGLLSLPTGDIWVFTTHLTHGDPEVNFGQAEDLLAFVKGLSPRVGLIGGDFNADETSPQILNLSKFWTDTYRLQYPNDSGNTCCLSDVRSGSEDEVKKRIDYLYLMTADGGLTIQSVEIVFDQPFRSNQSWIWTSDHYGVLLHLDHGE